MTHTYEFSTTNRTKTNPIVSVPNFLSVYLRKNGGGGRKIILAGKDVYQGPVRETEDDRSCILQETHTPLDEALG